MADQINTEKNKTNQIALGNMVKLLISRLLSAAIQPYLIDYMKDQDLASIGRP